MRKRNQFAVLSENRKNIEVRVYESESENDKFIEVLKKKHTPHLNIQFSNSKFPKEIINRFSSKYIGWDDTGFGNIGDISGLSTYAYVKFPPECRDGLLYAFVDYFSQKIKS